jgi:flagellar motor switch/type III secretory pathway protein FliN
MAQPNNPAVIEAPAVAAQSALAVDPWSGLLHISTSIAIDASIVGLTVRELFRLEKGSIVATRQPVGSNVPVHAGGSLIGWGEFQVVGDRLAVRVAELA